MGWAYSVDLRERVVAAFDRNGMTDQEAAELFKIGEATVRRWERLRREKGCLEPKKFAGGNPPRVPPEQYPRRARHPGRRERPPRRGRRLLRPRAPTVTRPLTSGQRPASLNASRRRSDESGLRAIFAALGLAVHFGQDVQRLRKVAITSYNANRFFSNGTQ